MGVKDGDGPGFNPQFDLVFFAFLVESGQMMCAKYKIDSKRTRTLQSAGGGGGAGLHEDHTKIISLYLLPFLHRYVTYVLRDISTKVEIGRWHMAKSSFSHTQISCDCVFLKSLCFSAVRTSCTSRCL